MGDGAQKLTDNDFLDNDFLDAANDAFWLAFSKLVAEHLGPVPARLRHSALELFQESASVYGSGYDRHL